MLWTPIPGTPDYASGCGEFVAVYKRTGRSGYANYWVFPATLPKAKRTMRNAFSVGGLPSGVDRSNYNYMRLAGRTEWK